MNIPRFWAKSTHEGFISWRWSQQSFDEAKSLASQAARSIAERFAHGGFDRNQRYGYGDRPMREQVLREFKDVSGASSAVITRNSYGCLVLNTARLMFIDVDLPEPKSSGSGFLKRLFGGTPSASHAGAEANILAKAESWARQNAGWGWRIYRTKAGLRLLATHALFDAVDPISEAVFAEVDADPLYHRLCKSQKCFRARLTPKPWRCGIHERPLRWPWPDARAEARFQEWEKRYVEASSESATCDLISTTGNTAIHPEAQPLISIHDETTRATSKLPLA